MKTKFKLSNRILSLVLALVMVLGMMSMMSMTTHAAVSGTITVHDLTYTVTLVSAKEASGKDLTIEKIQFKGYTQRINNDIVLLNVSLSPYFGGLYVTFTDSNCAQPLSTTFTTGSSDTRNATLSITRSAASHIGGTCVNPVCSRCGTTYDAPHNYNEWASDGTYHWQICKTNSSHTSAKVACSGGTATCHTLATCATCKQSYGSLNPNNHEWDAWHHVISEARSSHYRDCKYCEDTYDAGSCDPQPSCSGPTTCTICHCITHTIRDAHTWGTWKSNGDGTHTRTCTINSNHKETAACSGDPKATCTVSGTCTTCSASYTGPHKLTYTPDGFTITEKCTNNCGHQAIASIVAVDAIYTGSAITNTATISYDAGTWAGAAPVLSYEKNVDVGTATAKMTAGNATASTTFKINPANISYATVTIDPKNGTYNGSAYTPNISVTYKDKTLVEGTDYTVSWDKSGFINADSYTVTITGKGNFEGTKNAVFSINPVDIKDTIVTLDENTFVYDGNAHKPKVTVTFNGATLQEGTDYELWYMSEDQVSKWENGEPVKFFGNTQADSINAGQYYAVVFGKGNFAKNSDFAYAAYTIEKKQIDISWDATMHLPYNGSSLVPKAHATNLVIGDECVLTTEVVETEDGAGIIPGTWTAKVTALSNDNYKLPESGERVTATFEVVNGYQNDAPDVTAVNETINGKADGKITGVDSTMEYRKDGESTYTAITGTEVTGLADGTYYVRYAAKTYYNASPDKEVVIGAGRKLTVTVPITQTGYTLGAADTELIWNGSTTLTFALANGYSATDAFAVKVNGDKVELDGDGQYVITGAQKDIVVTVEGVADTTAPTVEIKVKDNSWTEFLKNITFGLYFKETQDVTITAADTGSGVKSIEYYPADQELGSDELEAIANWTEYNGVFKIDPNNRYVIYAKVTDNAGNITYVNSDGIVLDNVAPTLEGIENGKTYYGDLTVIKSNEQFYDIKMVTLDGEPMGFEEGTYGRIPADNAEHTVVVEDHAGNKTTYTVTVMKNYTVTFKADGVTVDTQTVGYGKDATAPTIPAKDGYVGKWDSDGKNVTEDTTISVVYTAILDVKADEVKPEDKTDLEDTKKQLEEMLDDDSYTEDDKKVIQDAIDDIDDALKVIENVEAVEELIGKLPENITKNDEPAIKAADDAYNALSDYEKSLVDKDAKKALDDAKAALAELNKPADPNSPQTGDNSNMFLWIALLFISGGAVITLTVVDRKRRTASK